MTRAIRSLLARWRSARACPMIGKLLGHTQVQTTARYAHPARDTVKASAAQHRRQHRPRPRCRGIAQHPRPHRSERPLSASPKIQETRCQRRLEIQPKGGAKECHLGWWAELGVRLGFGDTVRGFFGGSGQRSHAELKRSAPACRPRGGMVCRVGVSLAVRLRSGPPAKDGEVLRKLTL